MLVPSCSPALRYSGRWSHTPKSSVASWCSASVTFTIHGSGKLYLLSGPQSARKDRFNGGTPSLVWTVKSTQADDTHSGDVQGEETLLLLDCKDTTDRSVEIILADWASVLEITGFELEGGLSISLPAVNSSIPTLWIGDSITCGVTMDEQRPVPRGVYDAFPYVCKREYAALGEDQLDVQVIAYPGISLADYQKDGSMNMEQLFWQSSPFAVSENRTATYECIEPKLIVIALGTNDCQDASVQDYLIALHSFLLKLQDEYASTLQHVVLVPTLEEEDTAEWTKETQEVTSAWPDLKVKCNVVELDWWNAREKTVDGVHPTTEGHLKLGKKLAEVIHKLDLR